MKTKIDNISIITFQREKDSEREVGLILNSGIGNIIDSYGEVVNNVYDYTFVLGSFSLALGVIIKEVEKRFLIK